MQRRSFRNRYSEHSLGKHVRPHRHESLPHTVKLEPGILLFHGYDKVDDWEIPADRPSFFAGTMVALYYAYDQPRNIATYILTKPVALLDLGNIQAYRWAYSKLTAEDKIVFARVTGYNSTHLKTDFCGYKNKRKDDIRFCTEDFISKEDKKTGNYAMLRFARLICELGFDGYYIPPVFKRAYAGEKLTEQIILCHPKDKVLKVNKMSVLNVAKNLSKGIGNVKKSKLKKTKRKTNKKR